jgi:hypothetical protein
VQEIEAVKLILAVAVAADMVVAPKQVAPVS